MRPAVRTRLAAACAVVLALGGCGDLNTADDSTFVGLTYEVVEVSENGTPVPLVPGTQVVLTFTEEGISASAGCNTMSGGGGVEDDTLSVGDLASTQMACEPAVMEQEQWWSQFLSSDPAVDVGDRTLTLTSGDTAVKLVAQETVEDLPLLGTAWQLETIVSQDAASSVPEAGASTLTVTEGSLTVTVGTCRSTTVPATSTASTIDFAPASFAASACTGEAASVDEAVLAVFGSESVNYLIEGTRLTLSGPGGAQLVYVGS